MLTNRWLPIKVILFDWSIPIFFRYKCKNVEIYSLIAITFRFCMWPTLAILTRRLFPSVCWTIVESWKYSCWGILEPYFHIIDSIHLLKRATTLQTATVSPYPRTPFHEFISYDSPPGLQKKMHSVTHAMGSLSTACTSTPVVLSSRMSPARSINW